MKRLLALGLLAAGFATSAHADLIPATWTDSAPLGPNGRYIGAGEEYRYTHVITDTGYRPGIDVIDSFRLSINLADDDNNFWSDFFEVASVDLPGTSGDDGWITNFGLRGEEYGGWSIQGLAQLRHDGTLSVTVSSILGDFILTDSDLVARGRSQTGTSVPEPGALGLLGMSLVGMAVARRRKQKASA